MTNEERRDFYMNRNIKFGPSIIALTWDVIFIWTISTLYFTQVKGLSNSQVILLDSILTLIGCLFCVPVAKIFQNVSPKTSTHIGLVGYMAYLMICIFGNTYLTFILAQPFLSFGYAVISVKTNSILLKSLNIVKREREYQRIFGKGLSLYYILESVGAIVITYVYNWKPTMVFWISLGVVVFAEILLCFVKEPEKFIEKNVNINAKVEAEKVVKTPDSFFTILKSSFFILLLIYAFTVRGVLSVTASGFKIFLNFEMAQGVIPIWSYGYIFAGTRIMNAIASRYQFKFNLKFGVRSLILINIAIILGFGLTGAIFLINQTSIISVVSICLLSYLVGSLRTVNQIFLNNYMQVCTHKKNIERAYSIRTMVEYLGYAVISFVYAGLLSIFNDNYGMTQLIYITIFAVPLVVSMILFIKALIKKYTQKFTIIKDEYTKDN